MKIFKNVPQCSTPCAKTLPKLGRVRAHRMVSCAPTCALNGFVMLACVFYHFRAQPAGARRTVWAPLLCAKTMQPQESLKAPQACRVVESFAYGILHAVAANRVCFLPGGVRFGAYLCIGNQPNRDGFAIRVVTGLASITTPTGFSRKQAPLLRSDMTRQALSCA